MTSTDPITVDIPPPLPGHVGNLTSEQNYAIKQMWDALDLYFSGQDDILASKNLVACFTSVLEDPTTYPRPLVKSTMWSANMMDHPDSLLLRFLRARKWNIPKALSMLIHAIKWRIDFNVTDLIRTGEKGIALKELSSGKAYMRHLDRCGRPVGIIRACLHYKDSDPEDIKKYTVLQMETTRLMLKPGVETSNVLFDMRNFTLSNMDYAFVKFLTNCFEAYYPESLGYILIVSAPWIFWGVWKVIKSWLDPVVASKILFIKDKEELFKYIHPDCLPKRLGGNDDYEYKYLPPGPDEDSKLLDTEERERLMKEVKQAQEQFEQQTRLWKGRDVDLERERLAEELRIRWHKVDDYLRARTIYHRLGIIADYPECVRF